MDRRKLLENAGLLAASMVTTKAGADAAPPPKTGAMNAGPTVTLTEDAGRDPLHYVLPELRDGARQLLQLTPPPDTSISIQALVAGRSSMPSIPRSPAPEVIERKIASRAGTPDISVYVVNPRTHAKRGVIVHVHGGGFVLGRAANDLARLQAQALEIDCLIVAVEYRLSPETTFPGPVEDVYAALQWTYQHCREWGGDPSKIALQGESAGGGLAAMTAIWARDRREVPVIHQSLIYPMLDDRTGGKRQVPANVGTLAWTAQLNQAAWRAFLGQASSEDNPPAGAVPSRIADFAGLPSTFIAVGSIDLFVQEDIDYATRLIAASVPTELLVVPGAFHGFDLAVPAAKIVHEFRQAQLNALNRAFGRTVGEGSAA